VKERELSPGIGVAGREFDHPAAMASLLGVLFLAGATIGAFSLILPHPDAFDSPALWSNVGIAYVAGAGLILVPVDRRLLVLLLRPPLGAGTGGIRRPRLRLAPE
jgi:hypothetical protein